MTEPNGILGEEPNGILGEEPNSVLCEHPPESHHWVQLFTPTGRVAGDIVGGAADC